MLLFVLYSTCYVLYSTFPPPVYGLRYTIVNRFHHFHLPIPNSEEPLMLTRMLSEGLRFPCNREKCGVMPFDLDPSTSRIEVSPRAGETVATEGGVGSSLFGAGASSKETGAGSQKTESGM
jgi:hypothetical protein